MTNYQLVPYLVSVSVRNKPDETRPLDDIFAGGERLEHELAGALLAGTGQVLAKVVNKETHRLRIDSAFAGDRLLVAEVAPGKSGIVSTIQRDDGTSVARRFKDIELVPLRHLLQYAPGQHRAILFAERVGGNGAISALAMYLRDMWSSKHNQMILDIRPALSNEAMKAAIDAQPIERIRLTKPSMPNGQLMVGGQSVDYVLDVRPKRGHSWKLKKLGGTAGSILSEVVPIIRQDAVTQEERDAAAQQLLSDGWQVAVTVKFPSGSSRTIQLEDSAAISMSFPMVEDPTALAARPDDSVFVEGCRMVLKGGLLNDWGLSPSAENDCLWPDVAWSDQGDWKVQWDVISSAPTDT